MLWLVLQDEFASVRVKIRDILEENQRLHEALKHSVMEEIGADLDQHKVQLHCLTHDILLVIILN